MWDRRGVAVRDLAAGAVHRGGAVRVEDDLPAQPVDTDVMVELAQKYTISDGGFAAVLLMADVVHVAVARGAAAPGPGAALVAEQDRPANVAGDAGGGTDVERQ